MAGAEHFPRSIAGSGCPCLTGGGAPIPGRATVHLGRSGVLGGGAGSVGGRRTNCHQSVIRCGSSGSYHVAVADIASQPPAITKLVNRDILVGSTFPVACVAPQPWGGCTMAKPIARGPRAGGGLWAPLWGGSWSRGGPDATTANDEAGCRHCRGAAARWALFSDGLGVFCGLSGGGSGWLAA
jgi:hypothetical protein